MKQSKINIFPSLLLIALGLIGCMNSNGTPEAVKISHDSGNTKSTFPVTEAQLSPDPEAPFHDMYGKYRITHCDDRSQADIDKINLCGYANAVIFGSSQDSKTTLLMVTTNDGSAVKFASFTYSKTINSSTTKYSETPQAAVYSTSFDSTESKMNSKTQIDVNSNSQLRIALSNSSWINSPTAHNFDYEFILEVERQ